MTTLLGNNVVPGKPIQKGSKSNNTSKGKSKGKPKVKGVSTSLFTYLTLSDDESEEEETIQTYETGWSRRGQNSESERRVCKHSKVTEDVEPGVLIDTGAVHNCGGKTSVLSLVMLAQQAGHQSEWFPLAKPKRMSGIGNGEQKCVKGVNTPGMIEMFEDIDLTRSTHELVQYQTSVIEGAEQERVPVLFGNVSMKEMNMWIDTRNAILALVPKGAKVQMPTGTRFVKAQRSHTGHLIMPTAQWKGQNKTGNEETRFR